jgi:hypothetical protein
MLHARRKRLKELTEAEAKGESFWTKKFTPQARMRLWYAIADASPGDDMRLEVASTARSLIMTDEGLAYLTVQGMVAHADFNQYLLTCEDEMVPTVIEAAHAAIVAGRSHRNMGFPLSAWENAVTVILNENRISYELVNGRMTEFESKEMHEAVVEPTLRLLAGRSDLAAVEKAYQDALGEISKGNGPDAITDTGTALQEMFKALGCEGNQLDPLAKSAQKKGLLTGYDLKLIEWVAADRSTMGDTHNAEPATRGDAWLAVHVVGALILRLAANKPRRSEA